MKVEEFLSPSDAIAGLRANSKARVLEDLADRAARSLKLDKTFVARELSKREELGSTGMGNGIAIPHARLREVLKPFGILARLKRPIEFEAIDHKPVDLVFLLLLPAAAQGDQLNALAAVARKLREPSRLEALRQATDDAALYQEMTR